MSSKDPVATLAATLKMDKKSFTLTPSAFLQTSSRIRGPQYWDLRPGERPYEPVDLSSNLVDQTRAATTSECDTQADELQPRPPSPTWKDKHLKSGIDAESQVAHGSRAKQRRGSRPGGLGGGGGGGGGDSLFDFDVAVAPLAARLSRDVLTQALEELQREADLKALARKRGLVQGALNADARDVAATVAGLRAVAGRGAEKLGTARAAAAAALSALSKVSAIAMAGGATRVALEKAHARMRAEGDFVNAQALHARTVIMPGVYSRVAAALDGGKGVAEGILEGALVAALARSKAEAAAKEAARRKNEEAKLVFSIRVFVRLPRSKEDVEGEAHLPKAFTLPGEDTVDTMDEEVQPSHLALPPKPPKTNSSSTSTSTSTPTSSTEGGEAAVEGGSSTPSQEAAPTDAAAPTGGAVEGASAAQGEEGGGEEGGSVRPVTAFRPTTAMVIHYNVNYFRTVLVGPMSIPRFATVAEVEESIKGWLAATNSRHVRRILAMAGGAPLCLFLGGRKLGREEALLGEFGLDKRSLVGLELRPMASDGESSVQWLEVREEPLPSREELGLPPKEGFNDGEEGEEGEEGGEAAEEEE